MRNNRNRRAGDDFNGRDDEYNLEANDDNAIELDQVRALWYVNELIAITPRSDTRLPYLLALREQIERDETDMSQAVEALGRVRGSLYETDFARQQDRCVSRQSHGGREAQERSSGSAVEPVEENKA